MSGAHYIELSPESFYWAVLDVVALPKRRKRNPNSLGFLFENHLPLAIEEVQAVYLPIGSSSGASVVACGMSKADLRASLQSTPEALRLMPKRLPTFAGDTAIDPTKINLLVGEFEPPRLTRMRRRLCVHAIVILTILTALAVIGIERRAFAAHDRVAQAQGARLQWIGQVMDLPLAGNQPPDLALIAELRMLRQTRQSPSTLSGDQGTGSTIRDVTPALAALLQAWPTDLHVQTESISVTPTTMTLRGVTPQSDDVQRLANVLMSLEGWQLQQPEMATGSTGVNATLQWKRSAAAVEPEGGP
jgi:hypothetical protein